MNRVVRLWSRKVGYRVALRPDTTVGSAVYVKTRLGEQELRAELRRAAGFEAGKGVHVMVWLRCTRIWSLCGQRVHQSLGS